MTVVPAGWTTERLLDLVAIRRGQVDPREAQYRDMPLIAPDHIQAGTGRLLGVSSAREQGAISGKYVVDPGDVIYSKIRPYLMKAHRAQFSALCSADMYPLKPRDGVDGRYVVNVLLGRRFTTFAVGESMRSGIPKVNREALAGYELPVPPKSEQRAIGEVLSDADELISALERLIAKKRDVKQGIMQELLTGRTRLPGFTCQWSESTVGDVAWVKTGPFGSALHEEDYVSSGTPIITVEHLGEFGITADGAPMVSSADRRRLAAYTLLEGDVVFSRVGSIDRNARIGRKESGWLFSGRLLRLRFDASVTDSLFMTYQFRTETFRERVRSVAVGQTMPSLNTTILRGLTVTLPPLVEQRAIATVLRDADKELAGLERRLQSAQWIKTGMMQELLSGRTRLPATEEA